MTNRDRVKIEIDKSKEMRTKEISKMIQEGGLGAYTYYDFTKRSSSPKKETRSKEISKMIDEGGLGVNSYYNYQKKTIKNFSEESP